MKDALGRFLVLFLILHLLDAKRHRHYHRKINPPMINPAFLQTGASVRHLSRQNIQDQQALQDQQAQMAYQYSPGYPSTNLNNPCYPFPCPPPNGKHGDTYITGNEVQQIVQDAITKHEETYIEDGASPTPSRSLSVSISVSLTSEASVTPSNSPSHSNTPTVSVTGFPEPSSWPSESNSPSSSGSLSVTSAPTPERSFTPSVSPTVPASPSPSPSPLDFVGVVEIPPDQDGLTTNEKSDKTLALEKRYAEVIKEIADKHEILDTHDIWLKHAAFEEELIQAEVDKINNQVKMFNQTIEKRQKEKEEISSKIRIDLLEKNLKKAQVEIENLYDENAGLNETEADLLAQRKVVTTTMKDIVQSIGDLKGEARDF